MKITIELEGSLARRVFRLIADTLDDERAHETGEPDAALYSRGRPALAPENATDAGPPAPELFRAFGGRDRTAAAESAVGKLGMRTGDT